MMRIFGNRTPVPTCVVEGVIERIGVDDISSQGYVSCWLLTIEGDDRFLRVQKHRAPSERHLSLAKPGDVVRLTFRKGTIVELVNLSLTGSAATHPRSARHGVTDTV